MYWAATPASTTTSHSAACTTLLLVTTRNAEHHQRGDDVEPDVVRDVDVAGKQGSNHDVALRCKGASAGE